MQFPRLMVESTSKSNFMKKCNFVSQKYSLKFFYYLQRAIKISIPYFPVSFYFQLFCFMNYLFKIVEIFTRIVQE